MQLSPSATLSDAPPALLAADATTLAPAANANQVHLIINPINPETYIFNAADEATFTGGAAKNVGLGAQTVFRDPVTSDWIVILKEPVGGWTWVCTVTPGAPETAYAVCVTDNAGTTTLGSGLLTQGPTVISAAGDGVAEGDIVLRFPPGYMG